MSATATNPLTGSRAEQIARAVVEGNPRVYSCERTGKPNVAAVIAHSQGHPCITIERTHSRPVSADVWAATVVYRDHQRQVLHARFRVGQDLVPHPIDNPTYARITRC